MTRRTTIRVPAVLAAVTALFASGWGTASAAGPPVSQNPSPYATTGCLALDNQGTSRNYLNSEVEPMVSVDPTTPSHLVGAWQQDRWNDGGAHGLVAAYSTDGGTSWAVSPQPFSVCYHTITGNESKPYLNYQRASDPWVSIGPGAPGNPSGSTVYSDSISFDQTPYPGDPNAVDNAVGAAVSYDGGATWSNVQTVIADPCVSPQSSAPPGYTCNNSKAFVFNDKNSITADPTIPGVAYAVWDRLVAPPATGSGFIHERAYFGQAYMSKTTDYGQTWSAPQTLTSLASEDQTIANQIVVNHQSGQLYDFFTLIQNASNSGGHRGHSVAYITSTNHGATWSKPQVVSALETVGVSDPNNLNPNTNSPPAPSRTGDIIPEPAINPTNGQLYVVWQDARFNSFANDEAVISTSSDRGATWSAPALVNDHTGQPAYNASVYVSPTGTVGVTYLQWGTTVSGNEPTTVDIKHSLTAGSSSTAPTFDTTTVVDGPFNNLAAPVSRGYFLGDYAGLVANGSGFIPFYVKTNCADGNATTQPSCAAIQSVLSPTNRAPTDNNSTDVFAAPGS
jgi:BNR repeat-like domain